MTTAIMGLGCFRLLCSNFLHFSQSGEGSDTDLKENLAVGAGLTI